MSCLPFCPLSLSLRCTDLAQMYGFTLVELHGGSRSKAAWGHSHQSCMEHSDQSCMDSAKGQSSQISKLALKVKINGAKTA
jgi:hypothetical protein